MKRFLIFIGLMIGLGVLALGIYMFGWMPFLFGAAVFGCWELAGWIAKRATP